MGGGGKGYEACALEPAEFLLEARKEKVDEVVAHRTRSLTVVLDRLEDTFNMAAVLRTCEAMGLQEVHVIDHPLVPFEPHRKVSQGSQKWLDVVVHKTPSACLEVLRARGFELWVSAVREGGQSLFSLSFSGKRALVFGNERDGVSGEVLEAADGVFWIPMLGFTRSLNVSAAVAATVTRAVAWRQEHLGRAGDLDEGEASALRSRFQLLSVKQRRRMGWK